jgi:hypothetical protein
VSTEDTDIKDLLGRALGGQEPPLRLVRDEVFRVGRKRLRRRRAFEAGGVVAAVVAVVVGAATLTGLGGADDPRRLPPAASSSAPAPTTPELPRTSAPTRPDVPVSTSTGPVGHAPMTSEHAAAITEKLYRSAVMASRELAAPPGVSGKPKFVVQDGTYLFEADVIASGMEGALQVTISSGPVDRSVTCGEMPYPGDCEVVLEPDYQAPVATSDSAADKVLRRVASTILPDGTKVVAVVTNQSYRQLAEAQPSTSPKPPLGTPDLVELVLNSGLRVD